jgi:hypothetical protein
MPEQLWVEVVGEVIMARVRGLPTEEMLREVQRRVVALARETGKTCVLYDGLEMEPPPVEVPLVQRKLDEELAGLKLRRAVLVPNSKLAYLARLAFGDGEYRVFYNDMMGAIHWLGQGTKG